METKVNMKNVLAKKGSNRSMSGSVWTPYYFIAPAIIILLATILYPIIYSFYISMTNLSLSNFSNPAAVKIIGFTKYLEQLKDPDTYKLLGRTIIWTAANVFAHVGLGMFLAVLLNRKLPGKTFIRTLLILPWAVPQYIVALTWKGMLNTQYGAINGFLMKLGLPAVEWLGDGTMVFISAIITNIWLGFPFMMMIALGGLQSIPSELYEAADIDGATSWQQFKAITLPLLKPVMVPSIVLGTIWTFNQINVIYILAGEGKPESNILVTKIYKMAFNFFNYSSAAALSVILFIILAFFASSFVKANNATEEVY